MIIKNDISLWTRKSLILKIIRLGFYGLIFILALMGAWGMLEERFERSMNVYRIQGRETTLRQLIEFGTEKGFIAFKSDGGKILKFVLISEKQNPESQPETQEGSQ